MKKTKAFDKLINIPLKHPIASLLIILIIFCSLTYQLKFFKTDFSARIWHKNNSPEIIALNKFEKDFGGDEVFILGIIHDKNIFTQKNIESIDLLTEDLWLLPGVLRVSSLSNYTDIKFEEDDINISNLINLTDNFNLAELESRTREIPELENVFYNKDKNISLIYITLKPSLGENPDYTSFNKELLNTLGNRYKAENLMFLGSVAVANAFKEVAQSDNNRLFPVMMLLIALTLGFYFKSILATLVPLFLVIITLVESLGFLSLLEIKFNSILGAIPGVLLGICLADSIHVLTIFFQSLEAGNKKEEALAFSLKENLVPTVLTTLTTAISFMSIAVTDLVPIQNLGLVATFGTLMAWINTYFFLPSIIMILPDKFFSKVKKRTPWTIDLTPFVTKYRKSIISLFCFTSLIAGTLAFYNQADSDPLKYFSSETKIIQDFDFATEKFGTIRSLNIVVDSGGAEQALNPEFLNKVDSFITGVEKLKFVQSVDSLVGTLKKLNKNIEGKFGLEKIPSSREKVAESLFLYSLGTSSLGGTSNRITKDNRYLNISINWITNTTKDSLEKSHKIVALATELGLNANQAGTFSVYAGVNDKVVGSFFVSILIAIASVSLVLLLKFKKISISLMAIFPNLIPLLFVGAYTAIAGVYIDVGASIVFTICLGIAVDDTIHFLSHYLKNKKSGLTTNQALTKTYETTGEAIILTTVVLIIGFGSFSLAEFIPNRNFGIHSAMVLCLALLTDLLFLPALLCIFRNDKEDSEDSEGLS
jgi:hypothetical protein